MATAVNSRGISHPNTFSIYSGETQYSYEIISINQSIRLILTTAPGELFGDPDFGCRLHELIYDYAGDNLSDIISTEVSSALNKYETRIYVEPEDVVVDYNENERTANITINYGVRYTKIRDSFSFKVSSQGVVNLE